jgi:hypothetical protein
MALVVSTPTGVAAALARGSMYESVDTMRETDHKKAPALIVLGRHLSCLVVSIHTSRLFVRFVLMYFSRRIDFER